MGIAADRRAWLLPTGLIAIALAVGALAGVDPRLGLAAAMGLAFMTVVLADLSVGLCLYAVLAFLNAVPDVGGSYLSFDKVAGGLLAISWIATVVNRKEERRAFVSAHPLFTSVLLFFLAWATFSLTWAEFPAEGVEPLTRYLLDAMLFLIVFTAVRTPRHVMWLVGAFVLAAALSAAYGLVAPPPAGDEDRLAGTIQDPNELAAVLVAGVILASGMAAALDRRPILRGLALAAAALSLVCVFLTLSRGGLIALGVAVVAAIPLAGRWRAHALAFASVAVATLVVFFAFLATPQQRERVTTFGGGSGRSDIWTVGWRMVEAQPVRGVGVGNFQRSSIHFLLAPGAILRDEFIVDTPKVAHNMYLQVLTELGVVGLTAFLAILAFALACGLRAARLFRRRGDRAMELMSRAVLIALVGVLTADFFVSNQFSKQLWLLLGLGPALLALARRPEPPEPPAAPLAPERLEPAPSDVPALPPAAPTPA